MATKCSVSLPQDLDGRHAAKAVAHTAEVDGTVVRLAP
jgi:hypothetical protein